MSKRRGLNLEEKRTRMLEVFYEKKDVFQLKELEKIGPQEKGVVAQSVKDVVQSLVDDGYVDSEKIGTSQYFWALPSKATQNRKRKLDHLDEKESGVLKKSDEAVHETKRAKLTRSDTPERDELIGKSIKLKAEKERLNKLLEQYSDSDPEVIQKEKADIKMSIQAANRWTDNAHALRRWLKNKFSWDEADLDQRCPVDFDYLAEYN